jgi:hypothetical protein
MTRMMSPSRPLANTLVILSAAASLWSPSAAAQTPDAALLRQLYGELAFDVRAGDAGALRIGVADSSRSITLTLLAADLRKWADSATRILRARPARRGQAASWDAVVRGPGLAAGSIALTRSVSAKDTVIALLVTNDEFVAVRTNLTAAESSALAGAMKRAATTVLAPRKPPGPRPSPAHERPRL